MNSQQIIYLVIIIVVLLGAVMLYSKAQSDKAALEAQAIAQNQAQNPTIVNSGWLGQILNSQAVTQLVSGIAAK